MKPPLIITTESKMPKDSAKTLSTLLDDLRSFHFSTTPNLRSSQDSCRATCDNRSHGIYRAWRKIWVRPRGLLCYCKSEWVYWVAVFFFLSGFGLMESEQKAHLDLKSFVRRRLMKIYLPVVLVSCLWLSLLYALPSVAEHQKWGVFHGVQHYMKYCGISLIL